MTQPFEGIRIIDATHVLAGPFAAYQLALLGADVIKVEDPNDPDQSRMSGTDRELSRKGMGTYYLTQGSNKRSITLNLKSKEGQEIFKKLVADADVLVENYRPGALEKLGLGPDDLRAVNPKLVYVSVSGYGQTGPYRRRAGVNFTVEAFAGSLSITGEPDDKPMRTGIQTADVVSALFATYSALTGLVGVLRNRDGRAFDVSLSESTIAVAVWETAEYLATGHIPQRIGHRHRVHTPAQLFETGDNRYIALSAATDDQFRKLTEVLGIERECADPRFTTKSQRKKNEDELLKVLEPAIRKFSAKELEQKIVGVGIPCSPVNDYAQVFEDEHVKARGLVVEVNHPQLGRMKTVRNPVLMDKDGPDIRRAAPSHGQHTAEILGELGYDGRRIEALANAGTVKLADTGAATLKAAHA